MKEPLNWLRLKPNLNLLFPSLSGIILALCFPKVDFYFFLPLALLPLFFYLSSLPKEAMGPFFRAGFLFGLPYFGVIFYWIVYTLDRFTPLPLIASLSLLVLLSVYLSLYFSLLFLIVGRFQLLFPPSFTKGLLLSLLWLGAEYLRGTLLTGLPWGFLGEALANYPTILQTADLFGVYGLSFLSVMINYTFFFLFHLLSQKERPIKILSKLSPFLFLFFLSHLYGLETKKNWEQILTKEKNSLKIAILQGNIPQELKESKELIYSFNVYQRLLLEALSFDPHVVFTPETAFPFYFPWEKDNSVKLLTILLEVKKKNPQRSPKVVFGAFRVANSEKLKVHNTLFVWDGENILDFYDKEKLVPFGEYIPLGNYFPFLKKISVVSDILKPGIGKNLRIKLNLEDFPQEFYFTPLICFESAFSELARKRSNQGGEFMFVATNDAWFGETSAPYQHFNMLKLRAIENRRFVIQAANTGISGVVDPMGRILKQTGLNTQEILIAQIFPINYQTIYQKGGYLFPLLGTSLYLSLLLYLFIQNFIPRRVIFFKIKKL